MQTKSRIAKILETHEQDLIADWLNQQNLALSRRSDLLSNAELTKESSEFLSLLREALGEDVKDDLSSAEWEAMKQYLGRISFSRAEKGFNPSETALFILSFKQPLFRKIHQELEQDPNSVIQETWNASKIMDQLGLYTAECYQTSRNKLIARQQKEILELSTPVVRLWSGILALPLIGTLDSERTQVVMDNLLRNLIDTSSSIAIIDITGVPTVDTLVAQHLLKTVAAARLMGADCFISGIRPQIAQTIVQLGVSLPDVVTKATLADAFAVALRRVGLKVTRQDGQL